MVQKPSKVTGVHIGGRASDALRINWNKVNGASGYIIEKYDNGKWNRIARIADVNTKTYRVGDLKNASSYLFRIQSFSFNDNTPIYSDFEYIDGKTNPAGISGVRIGGQATDALRVNWNKVSGASGYIVDKFENGSWIRVARIADANVNTYRMEGLKNNTSYVIRVQAFSFDGKTPLYGGYQIISGNTL